MPSSPPHHHVVRIAQPRLAKPGSWRNVASTRGSVSAEIAVVLPAITALLAVLLLSVSAGMLQLRLEEGARAGARALARGDSTALVLELVSRVAGERVTASLASSGGYATVTVQGKVEGVLSGLVPWTQSAQASARIEAAASKSSLWRWVEVPHCQFRAAVCSAGTVTQLGGDRDVG
ncbi:TadE family type IV pilus minor pilin [Arthrobacter sp. TMN-49]